MYTLIRTYGIKKALNSLWGEHDITLIPLKEIFLTFKDIYVELSNPLIAGPVYVRLKDLEVSYSNDLRVIDELFTDEPSLALPTVVKIPNYELKSAVYMDAFRAGYKLELTAPGHSPESNVSKILKTEIAIRREATSTKDMHDYCLFTANGFLHQTDYDSKYLYVVDGGKTLHKSRRNTCGINSFERIGKVHKKQIELTDITAVGINTPLCRQVLLKVPADYVGKSIMLSIGGYLVIPEENTFVRIADDLWVLNTEKLDLVGRYFESRNYLDFSTLGLTTFPEDKDKVSLLELQSDEVVKKYLTLSQSFFIGVEAEELTCYKKYVRHSSLANEFVTYSNPTSPLFLGLGRQADYWKQQDEAQWCININDGSKPNLTKDKVDGITQLVDSGSNTPYRIYENSRAFLLEIVTQKLTN